MPKKLYLETVGCQMNVLDSELVVGSLRRQVAQRYGRSENEVAVLPFAPALAVKITLPRDIVSGDIGDRDVYGAQQHAPLLDIEL